jgi:rhamnopyranosyl-N-acetylglucosaminyl-diphospho-decaprenol beta-1,3/1,4-galactofuranosyltransferase
VKGYNYEYIKGGKELGGAGGYALGMKIAFESGSDLVWLADDDGYPDSNCLKLLIDTYNKSSLEVLAPLCISQTDHSQTANPYPLRGKKVTEVSKMNKVQIHKNLLQLFNGVIISKVAFLSVGYPDSKLFIRGDELDYYFRIKKKSLPIGIVTSALYYHPQSDADYPNSRNSILGVVVPKDDLKRYYQFRNQGYLARKHQLIGKMFLDWTRYSIFFLLTSKFDLYGFNNWRKLWIQGFTLNLQPYKSEE